MSVATMMFVLSAFGKMMTHERYMVKMPRNDPKGPIGYIYGKPVRTFALSALVKSVS
jgi:hypothetical protein